jgi:hypothetical protein
MRVRRIQRRITYSITYAKRLPGALFKLRCRSNQAAWAFRFLRQPSSRIHMRNF